MRVAVCGGDEADGVYKTLTELDGIITLTCIIHGGEALWASLWANTHGIEVLEYPPDVRKYGGECLRRRNEAIIEYGRPDMLVVFPGGNRPDIADLVARALAAGVEVVDY